MPVRAECSRFRTWAPEIPHKSLFFEGADGAAIDISGPEGDVGQYRAVKAASGIGESSVVVFSAHFLPTFLKILNAET
jgi:hypothetical protein